MKCTYLGWCWMLYFIYICFILVCLKVFHLPWLLENKLKRTSEILSLVKSFLCQVWEAIASNTLDNTCYVCFDMFCILYMLCMFWYVLYIIRTCYVCFDMFYILYVHVMYVLICSIYYTCYVCFDMFCILYMLCMFWYVQYFIHGLYVLICSIYYTCYVCFDMFYISVNFVTYF